MLINVTSMAKPILKHLDIWTQMEKNYLLTYCEN